MGSPKDPSTGQPGQEPPDPEPVDDKIRDQITIDSYPDSWGVKGTPTRDQMRAALERQRRLERSEEKTPPSEMEDVLPHQIATAAILMEGGQDRLRLANHVQLDDELDQIIKRGLEDLITILLFVEGTSDHALMLLKQEDGYEFALPTLRAGAAKPPAPVSILGEETEQSRRFGIVKALSEQSPAGLAMDFIDHREEAASAPNQQAQPQPQEGESRMNKFFRISPAEATYGEVEIASNKLRSSIDTDKAIRGPKGDNPEEATILEDEDGNEVEVAFHHEQLARPPEQRDQYYALKAKAVLEFLEQQRLPRVLRHAPDGKSLVDIKFSERDIRDKDAPDDESTRAIQLNAENDEDATAFVKENGDVFEVGVEPGLSGVTYHPLGSEIGRQFMAELKSRTPAEGKPKREKGGIVYEDAKGNVRARQMKRDDKKWTALHKADKPDMSPFIDPRNLIDATVPLEKVSLSDKIEGTGAHGHRWKRVDRRLTRYGRDEQGNLWQPELGYSDNIVGNIETAAIKGAKPVLVAVLIMALMGVGFLAWHFRDEMTTLATANSELKTEKEKAADEAKKKAQEAADAKKAAEQAAAEAKKWADEAKEREKADQAKKPDVAKNGKPEKGKESKTGADKAKGSMKGEKPMDRKEYRPSIVDQQAYESLPKPAAHLWLSAADIPAKLTPETFVRLQHKTSRWNKKYGVPEVEYIIDREFYDYRGLTLPQAHHRWGSRVGKLVLRDKKEDSTLSSKAPAELRDLRIEKVDGVLAITADLHHRPDFDTRNFKAIGVWLCNPSHAPERSLTDRRASGPMVASLKVEN